MTILPFVKARAMCVVSLATSAAAAARTRLLLFDLDDTLWHTVATLDGAHKAWVEYIRGKGFTDVAEAYVDRKVGAGEGSLMMKCWCGSRCNRWWKG